MRPLLLVVLTAEHRGVGERVAEHHPLGEVALLGRLALVRKVGNTGSPARITLVTPALFSLAMMVRASCCAVARSSEYGTVTAGFTW